LSGWDPNYNDGNDKEFYDGIYTKTPEGKFINGEDLLLTDKYTDGISVFADTILSLDVIEHVQELDEYMDNIHRILLPDGRLIVILPHKWWLFEQHGAYIGKIWNRIPLWHWLPSFIHRSIAKCRIYTRRSAKRMLHDYGFNVIHTELITAPLDVAGESWPGRLWRYLYPWPTTKIPFIATNIFIVAEKM